MERRICPSRAGAGIVADGVGVQDAVHRHARAGTHGAFEAVAGPKAVVGSGSRLEGKPAMVHRSVQNSARTPQLELPAAAQGPQKQHLQLQLEVLSQQAGFIVKCGTDSAYARTANVRPRHTPAQLAALPPAERAAVSEQDRLNAVPRATAEQSFNNVVTRWRSSNCKRSKRLFQGGQPNFAHLCETWQLQVLFQNLYTCCYGSQISGLLGIEPPTVAEYLQSVNDGALPQVDFLQ